MSTRCTEMIADYSAKIKIVIFQSVWKRQLDEWRSSSNCGRIAAKVARFNSVNSEIVGQKFTKFGYDVAWLLPLNHLKADLRWPIRCRMLKQSKSRSTRRRLYNCKVQFVVSQTVVAVLYNDQCWAYVVACLRFHSVKKLRICAFVNMRDGHKTDQQTGRRPVAWQTGLRLDSILHVLANKNFSATVSYTVLRTDKSCIVSDCRDARMSAKKRTLCTGGWLHLVKLNSCTARPNLLVSSNSKGGTGPACSRSGGMGRARLPCKQCQLHW